jgi:hypothetical protein
MQVASKILLKIRDKGFNSMEALEKRNPKNIISKK